MRSETYKSRKFLLISGLLILALALSLVMVKANPSSASDPYYDLTMDNPDWGDGAEINGAWWFGQPETGISIEFLEYANNGTERGYNTDGTVQFDETPQKTMSVAFADMTPMEYDSSYWFEFQVDLNEQGGDPYISLDEFQVWQTDDPEMTGYHVNSDDGSGDGYFDDATLVYDMDGDTDTWLMMDYSMGEGSSGAGEDYRVLVPVSSFSDEDYVVLYVRMGYEGGDWDSAAGPEQWGLVIYPGAPEPGVPDTQVSFVAPPTSVDVDEEFDLVIQEANTGIEGDTPGDVDLVGVYVLLDDGTITETLFTDTLSVTLDSGTYTVLFSGDTGDDDVLGELETWTWTIQDVALGEGEDTTFTASGHGWVGTPGTEDDADDISAYNGYDEEDTAPVSVNAPPEPGNPSTEVTIEADPEFVVEQGEEWAGEAVTLTIIEENDGEVDLYDVYVVLFDGADYTNLNASSAVESMTDDDVLEVGETMTWTEVVVVAVDTTFTANGHGWVDGTQGDSEEDICCDEGYCSERDSIMVEVVAPYTEVGISVPTEIVFSTGACVWPGDEVTLTITEQNTGDQDLEDVCVTVTNDLTSDEWELEADSPATVEFDGEDYAVTFAGDNGEAGVLDVGETWSWTIEGVVITETTVFEAIGYGELEDDTEITYPEFEGEMDELEIFVVEPETCLTLNVSGYKYMESIGGIDTYYFYRGQTATLEIMEDNQGNCDISDAHVVLDDGTTFTTLNDQTVGVVQSHVDAALEDNGILDYDELVTHDGEIWYWEVPMVMAEDTTFTVNGYGVVLHENIDTANGYENETDMINIVVMDRGTFLSICMETDVDSCGCTCGEAWVLNADKQNKGTLVITEKNWGDVDLHDVSVVVENDVTADEWLLTDETTEVDFGVTCTGCMDPCMEPEPDCVPNTYAVTFSGDDGDGVLEPGEIWKWVIEDVEFSVDTVFTANGFAWDYGDGEVETVEDNVLVSYDEGFVCERDSVCIYIAGIHPSTLVHMCTVEDILYSDGGRYVYPGETVTVEVTEENNGDVALTDAYVELKAVTGAGTDVQILDASTATESMTDDDILEVGEIWTWTAEVVIEIDTILVADGHGFVLCHDISYENGFMCERDKLLIEVVEPDTVITIEADPEILEHAGTVTLTITETNTGNCDVSNAYVVVDHGVGVLTAATASGDGGLIGVLDMGETWTWTVEDVQVGDAITFTASGYGIVLGEPVSYENGYLGERDSVTILSVNPETQVTIDADQTTIPAGSTLDLTITEENIGNADLFGVYVELECIDEVTLDDETTSVTINSVVYAVVFSGDDGDDGVLGVGEYWTWVIVDVVFDVDTCVIANGHGWVEAEDIGNEETDVSKENGYLCEEDTYCINVTLAA
ncbi:hypothetical protein ACFLXA_01775 [Chloroflexota bacterium]